MFVADVDSIALLLPLAHPPAMLPPLPPPPPPPTAIDECDLLFAKLPLMKPLVLSPPLLMLVLYNFGLELIFFISKLSCDSRNVESKRSFEPVCDTFLSVAAVAFAMDFGVADAVAVDDDDAVDRPILFKLDVDAAPRIGLFACDDGDDDVCFEDPDGPCPLRNNDFNLIIAHLSGNLGAFFVWLLIYLGVSMWWW